jgi:hypothetical protein
MRLDRYFWIASGRIVGLLIVAGILLVGLNTIIDAVFTKEQFLRAMIPVTVAMGFGSIFVLGAGIVALACGVADGMRSRAE